MLWAALNELSPRNRLRLPILTYGPVFLAYSPIFCWRSDNPLPGASPATVQGFLLLPHVACEIPVACYVFVMDALPTGDCSFWCSAWCLCFMSGPYLLIYFMTSTHSDLQSLQTLFVAYFSCLVCSVSSLHLVFGSQGMNRLWLNASFFRWEVSIILKPFSAFYEFFALSKHSMDRHWALPIGHLQLYL